MELDIRNRLILLNALPSDGVRISDLRIIKELQLKLGFTEDEQMKFGFQQEGERLLWDTDADVPADIDIGPRAFLLIQERLQALNTDKQLTMDHLDLWDLFDCDNEKE